MDQIPKSLDLLILVQNEILYNMRNNQNVFNQQEFIEKVLENKNQFSKICKIIQFEINMEDFKIQNIFLAPQNFFRNYKFRVSHRNVEPSALLIEFDFIKNEINVD